MKFLSTDGFSIFIFKLKELLETRFFDLKESAQLKIPWIIDKFVRIDFVKIVEVLMITIRNVVYGDLSEKTRSFAEKMFSVLKNNISWVNRQNDIGPLILFKAIRLYSGYCYLGEQNAAVVKKILMEVIIEIWRSKKNECISLGRELIRVLQETFRHSVFKFKGSI